jgi:hypothetical protein
MRPGVGGEHLRWVGLLEMGGKESKTAKKKKQIGRGRLGSDSIGGVFGEDGDDDAGVEEEEEEEEEYAVRGGKSSKSKRRKVYMEGAAGRRQKMTTFCS